MCLCAKVKLNRTQIYWMHIFVRIHIHFMSESQFKCCWICWHWSAGHKFIFVNEMLSKIGRMWAIWFDCWTRVWIHINKQRNAYCISMWKCGWKSISSCQLNIFSSLWMKSTPNDRLFLLLWLYYFNLGSL